MNIKSRLIYFALFLLILAVEIIIALFVKDSIIRPFVGDALVVVLIYCFLRIFLNYAPLKLAFGVLIFAIVIEILQFFDYVKLLGLQDNRFLSIMMGRTFEWSDFVAYLGGFLLIITGEKLRGNNK